MPDVSQIFDFPSQVRDAMLAALLLLIPITAQFLATYLHVQLKCLSDKLEANTRLTRRTLTNLDTTNAQLEETKALIEEHRDRRRSTDPAPPDPEVL